MKRRIISLILAALLLLPMSVSVAATTPVTITSDDVRGSVGDTVTVAINIAIEAPKLGQTMDSLQFVLEYDSAALEYAGIQELSQERINIMGVQYTCNVTTKSGAVIFTAASADGCSGSGVLMHVRFKIKSAVSTMLVLKKVSYSFVSSDGKTQRSYNTGGVVNLGRVTGQSVPNTIAPYSTSTAPANTQAPGPAATDEPRFPVTEITQAPGTSPAPEPDDGDSDILAYIVFGLFIVVAILICVVLTLMIVRRGRNKARIKYFEDDEEEELPVALEEDERGPVDEVPPEEDGEDEEPPIRIVRRGKKSE